MYTFARFSTLPTILWGILMNWKWLVLVFNNFFTEFPCLIWKGGFMPEITDQSRWNDSNHVFLVELCLIKPVERTGYFSHDDHFLDRRRRRFGHLFLRPSGFCHNYLKLYWQNYKSTCNNYFSQPFSVYLLVFSKYLVYFLCGSGARQRAGDLAHRANLARRRRAPARARFCAPASAPARAIWCVRNVILHPSWQGFFTALKCVFCCW